MNNKHLINICGPIGSGKTYFVEDWAAKTSAGLQILTPARLGESILKCDARFDRRQACIYVFDEFHQWEIKSLAQVIDWLLTDFGKDSPIQVVVVSQDEAAVLSMAQWIRATVTTVRLPLSNVVFDDAGFIVGVTQRIPVMSA